MAKKFNIADIDLDMPLKTRESLLNELPHIPASKITDDIIPHNIGVYFCDIPKDDLTGLASIDYKRAEEELGYVKVDFLHNTIYDRFKTPQELEDVLNKPVDWTMLKDKGIVNQLPHINNYYDKLQELPPITSIEDLAKFIALIRPGKIRYYDRVKESQDWHSIDDVIWQKEENAYYYKKSHSIAYALSITVVMKTLDMKEDMDWLIKG